jgi:hypothetical protein
MAWESAEQGRDKIGATAVSRFFDAFRDCCRFRKSRYFNKLNFHESLRPEKVEEICQLRKVISRGRNNTFPKIH